MSAIYFLDMAIIKLKNTNTSPGFPGIFLRNFMKKSEYFYLYGIIKSLKKSCLQGEDNEDKYKEKYSYRGRIIVIIHTRYLEYAKEKI